MIHPSIPHHLLIVLAILALILSVMAFAKDSMAKEVKG
jgi:hypothetical protein